MGDNIILVKNKKLAIWSIVIQIIIVIYKCITFIENISNINFKLIAAIDDNIAKFHRLNLITSSLVMLIFIVMSIYMIIKLIYSINIKIDITSVLKVLVVLNIIKVLTFIFSMVHAEVCGFSIYNNILVRCSIYICLPIIFCYNIISYLKHENINNKLLVINYTVLCIFTFVNNFVDTLPFIECFNSFYLLFRNIMNLLSYILSSVGILLFLISIGKDVTREDLLKSNTTYINEEKSIFIYVIFSLLTLGIYNIVIFFEVHKRTNLILNKRNNVFKEMILFFLIPFYNLYWFNKYNKMLNDYFRNKNLDIANNCVIFSILSFLRLNIICFCIMQNSFNIYTYRNNGSQKN